MRVRIIPEGVQHDHLILKPIFEAMFDYLGKGYARIDIHSPKVRRLRIRQKPPTLSARSWPSSRKSICSSSASTATAHPHRREALDDLERKIRKILHLRACSSPNMPGRRSRSGPGGDRLAAET